MSHIHFISAMPIPSQLPNLIERFERNREEYRKGRFNETQLRIDYLNPVFELLGWDMTNRAGYSEKYRDVIHEAQVKVGGVTKAPDYCFKIGPQRKFFLEAKKPSVNIEKDTAPAFQLRRYAWSANLPLSILSDFEEFAVYDCRVKPDRLDRATAARIMYFKFDQLADRWDEFASIFSKEAVLQGSFDRYAESAKVKRGTARVDDAFLTEIESWRETLAKDIAKRNSFLSQRDLNDAVQRTIDRIIFLRICEDRGIEEYGRLLALRNGANVYPRLMQIFHQADSRYNSGLFHFNHERGEAESPDELTPTLEIDDTVLKEIFRRLYYPDSPYEFSVLPASILGQVYEQFLGKVICLDKKHHATIEEKPEVRKAGGVYYTPEYIAKYIVQNTVGKLVEGKTPKEITKIRVLDPACGSGSFLLVAYAFLLEWHLQWYSENEPEKHATKKDPPIYKSSALPTSGDLFTPSTANWRLTTNEKKRILLNNIYGVDIDLQAVEVTKLSLLLKMLEGESDQTIGKQMKLMQDRVLPDLASNIKCGNSLIESDFYDDPTNLQLEVDVRRRINTFDWSNELRDVMRAGGFDAVIGNPPYLGGREWKEENGRQYSYFVNKFRAAEYQFDMYALFWEQCIELSRKGGFIGLITPNTWLNNQSNLKLRKYILDSTSIECVIDYSLTRVFAQAVVLPIVTVLRKLPSEDNRVDIYSPKPNALVLSHSMIQSAWRKDEHYIINIDLHEEDMAIRSKIELDSTPLEQIAEVKFGIKIYETGKGTPAQTAEDAKRHVFESEMRVDATYRRYLEGKDIDDYQINWKNRWLKYGPNLAAPRRPDLFEGERILVRRIVGKRLICAYTDESYVTSQLLQIVKPNDVQMAKYLLGVLNSSLIAYFFRKKYNRQDKTFPEIRIYELRSLPIYRLDLANPSDRAKHGKINTLVERMLTLHQQLINAKSASDKTFLQRQIDQIDAQINRAVYELYDLTEEEIAIVERSVAPKLEVLTE